MSKRRTNIRTRTRKLREAIAAMDYVAAGAVSARMKLCGRPNCACARDPAARHGPYHEWHRYQDGRLAHRTLTAEQAAILAGAVANFREIQRLLVRWEEETVTDVLDRPKSGTR
jgi:hypothetical protein